MADVVVVGAGPVGLLLAGELARRDVEVSLFERRPSAGGGTRAIGVHAPVLAALEPSGLTEHLLGEAVRVSRGEAHANGRVLGAVRFDRYSTRFPFVATLPQASTEQLRAGRAPEPLRGATVMSLARHSDGVRVRVGVGGRPTELTAPIVVVASGAGGRDLGFRPAATRVHAYRDRYLMADADVAGGDDLAVIHLDGRGVLESFPLPGGRRRLVAWDHPGADSDPALRTDRLRAAVAARGEAEASAAISGASAFGVRRFVAPRLRNGRVIVIGDAAHEVSPIGGQGMNLGLLDAATLAPLLAEWVRTGTAPDADLARWEARRVRSARVAARLAAANTVLGRALPQALDAGRRALVRAMLAPPLDRAFARAYAMGFDADA